MAADEQQRICGCANVNLFQGFFQLGYVGADLDAAVETIRRDYGVTKYRLSQKFDWLRQAHTWVGDLMIEINIPARGMVPAFDDYIPQDPATVNLHHLAYMLPDEAAWEATCAQIEAAGMPLAASATMFDGEMKAMYVDTRRTLGHYSEFLLLTGSARDSFYADVPRN